MRRNPYNLGVALRLGKDLWAPGRGNLRIDPSVLDIPVSQTIHHVFTSLPRFSQTDRKGISQTVNGSVLSARLSRIRGEQRLDLVFLERSLSAGKEPVAGILARAYLRAQEFGVMTPQRVLTAYAVLESMYLEVPIF
jgi:hypothetical protein